MPFRTRKSLKGLPAFRAVEILAAGVLAMHCAALSADDLAPAPAPQQDRGQQTSRQQQRDGIWRQAVDFQRAGKTREALAEAKKAYDIQLGLFGRNHATTVEMLAWVADVREEGKEFPRALAVRREVLAITSALYEKDDWRIADARAMLAHTQALSQLSSEQRQQLTRAEEQSNQVADQRKQGKGKEALQNLRTAAETVKSLLGDASPDYASYLDSLGSLYIAEGQPAQAEPLYQHALTIWEKAFGPHHPSVAQSLNNLGLLHHQQQHYAQAEPLYQRALEIWEKALGPNHPNVALVLNNLALLQYDQGHYADAEPLYQRSLAIK
jgi:tetratricopeptide (TPR) repeat protein